MTPTAKKTILCAVLLLLLAFPWGAPGVFSNYYVDLLTKIMIFGIALLGFDILSGYTGLVSLGHAMFFGLGGYCAAFVRNTCSTNIFLSLIAAIVVALILGLIVGYFSTQTKDIFFVFLTLAFAQFFYLAAFNLTNITGGDNGIIIKKATVGIPGVWESAIQKPNGFYYLVLLLLCLSYLFCLRVTGSPFGKVLVGIRENEDRVSFLGYNVRTMKIKAYVISAFLTTIAGVLFASFQDFVSPGMLNWSISGDFILMSILGGIGTLVGPVLGGAIILWLGDVLSSWTENWMIFIGAFFVLTIIFAPQGILGLFNARKSNNR